MGPADRPVCGSSTSRNPWGRPAGPRACRRWLPDGASSQAAYRIRTDRWDSGRVESGASVLVPYAGPALSSRERTSWRVKLWTDEGESNWSAASWWEIGLLDAADGSARWIAPVEDEPGRPGHRPAYLFRHELHLDAPVGVHPVHRARAAAVSAELTAALPAASTRAVGPAPRRGRAHRRAAPTAPGLLRNRRSPGEAGDEPTRWPRRQHRQADATAGRALSG